MEIREFKFFHGVTIQSEGIQDIIRRLRAQWLPELQEDLIQHHNIDAEEELTRLLSNQIQQEIDNNFLENLHLTITTRGNVGL